MKETKKDKMRKMGYSDHYIHIREKMENGPMWKIYFYNKYCAISANAVKIDICENTNRVAREV